MKEILSEIDFNDVPDPFEPDMFEPDPLETGQPSEPESSLAAARVPHEERIHAFWRRFGLVYGDEEP